MNFTYLEGDPAIPDPPEVPDKDRKIDRKEVERQSMKKVVKKGTGTLF